LSFSYFYSTTQNKSRLKKRLGVGSVGWTLVRSPASGGPLAGEEFETMSRGIIIFTGFGNRLPAIFGGFRPSNGLRIK